MGGILLFWVNMSEIDKSSSKIEKIYVEQNIVETSFGWKETGTPVSEQPEIFTMEQTESDIIEVQEQQPSTETISESTAYESNYGFYYRTLDNSSVKIIRYTGDQKIINIPETLEGKTVTEIGEETFLSRDSVTEITIPKSVIRIGSRAFLNCSALEKIEVDGQNTVYLSEQGVLFNKNKTELIQYPSGKTETDYAIPEGVISVEEEAFCYNDFLEILRIPKSTTELENSGIYSCYSLKYIDVAAENPVYIGEDGVLFTKDKTKLIQYPSARMQTSYTIPQSVTTIGESAFNSAKNITEVMIPEGVLSIEKDAFQNCSSLKTISLPKTVLKIGYGAFPEIENITILNEVCEIDASAIQGKSATIGTFASNVQIYGISNSTAQSFAETFQEDGKKFVSIGEETAAENMSNLKNNIEMIETEESSSPEEVVSGSENSLGFAGTANFKTYHEGEEMLYVSDKGVGVDEGGNLYWIFTASGSGQIIATKNDGEEYVIGCSNGESLIYGIKNSEVMRVYLYQFADKTNTEIGQVAYGVNIAGYYNNEVVIWVYDPTNEIIYDTIALNLETGEQRLLIENRKLEVQYQSYFVGTPNTWGAQGLRLVVYNMANSTAVEISPKMYGWYIEGQYVYYAEETYRESGNYYEFQIIRYDLLSGEKTVLSESIQTQSPFVRMENHTAIYNKNGQNSEYHF